MAWFLSLLLNPVSLEGVKKGKMGILTPSQGLLHRHYRWIKIIYFHNTGTLLDLHGDTHVDILRARVVEILHNGTKNGSKLLP
jgi:hypothetical protein